jgi:cyclic-di-AMP phosphodiesterase PgpH
MSLFSKARSPRRTIYLILLLIFTMVITLVALAIPFTASLAEEPLRLGSVAREDIRAPYDFTYQSKSATEENRKKAVAEVSPVYTLIETSVARRQMEHLRSVIAYIDSVRADAFASREQKLSDLDALENVQLRRQTAQSILSLSDARWQIVQQEAIVVLEQVMRATIREDRLEDVRRSVPTLISLSLPEEQASIVAEMVQAFVTPNSLYDEAATKATRQAARENVVPVMRSYMAGETVVRRGELINEEQLESLQELGLDKPQYRWQDLASAAFLAFLVISFLIFYMRRTRRLVKDLRSLTVMTVLFLAFLFGARLVLPGHTVVPYLFPLPAYSLAVAALFGAQPALVSTLPLAISVSFGLPYSLELTVFYIITSFFGVLTLGRAQRITTFFWSGFVIACAGTTVILVYRLPQPSTDWIGILTLSVAALFYGIASAGSSLLLQFFLAPLMGKTTALQLMELSRPDHPLLQLILHNAPGTYQHSLQVANLAEQAAERIGADPLLTRIGALYHDVGKAAAPVFFIENQAPGSINPHNGLDPTTSAATIINHVYKGLELARKYRLPRRIQDFIIEHHGDSIARYQYAKALEAAGGDENQVEREKFRYPGPRPQSCETALLMLADGSEAKVRADRPKDENELRLIIKAVVDNAVALGALNDTSLTLHDLDTIIDSFTATLRGIYHPRISYPKMEISGERPALLREHASEDAQSATKPLSATTVSNGDPPANPSPEEAL